jgi:hypothetical protein
MIDLTISLRGFYVPFEKMFWYNIKIENNIPNLILLHMQKKKTNQKKKKKKKKKTKQRKGNWSSRSPAVTKKKVDNDALTLF